MSSIPPDGSTEGAGSAGFLAAQLRPASLNMLTTASELADTAPTHLAKISIPSCLTEHDRKGKYTSFEIEIQTHGGFRWTVRRRYREFYSLNQALRERYSTLRDFKFPAKKWFSSFATATVERRRRDFEAYLKELVCVYSLALIPTTATTHIACTKRQG